MANSLLIGVFLNIVALPYVARAQVETDDKVVEVRFDEEDLPSLLKRFASVRSMEAFQRLKPDLLTSFHLLGYLAPVIDSSIHSDTLLLSTRIGEKYSWEELRFEEDAAALVRKAGMNPVRLERGVPSQDQIKEMFERSLTEAENSGFPFAALYLDSVEISESRVSALVRLDQGPFIRIDSVSIDGDLNVREGYITNYLGVKEGSAYSERAIERIPDKLSSVRFLTAIKPPEVLFSEDKTKITLFLNKRNASSFDGIIGFLPDNNTGDLLITGDVKLHLENTLKQGEVIDLNWRKLQTNTQELNLEVISPYILNSAISLDGNLKIYRRDTLFTDVFRQLGIRYVFGSDDYVRVFVDRQTTSLISTQQYESTIQPPPFLDRSITSYGVGFRYSRLDNRINPANGFEVDLTVAAGTKNILENDNLPEVIYDSLTLSSLQLKASLDASYYLSFIPRLVWHQRGMGAHLMNDQLFNNEAFRIGGLKNLRGVDEEAIFATSYFIARSEMRYQFDRQGYVFGFFDASWYENRSLNRIGATRDTPFASGLGVTFGTRAGLFSLSYALGSQQGNPFLLRAAKVHFGFLSLF